MTDAHPNVTLARALFKRPDFNAGITMDDSFPATTVYIKATVSDMSGGESHLFYQIAGRRTRVP